MIVLSCGYGNPTLFSLIAQKQNAFIATIRANYILPNKHIILNRENEIIFTTGLLIFFQRDSAWLVSRLKNCT